MKVTLKQIAERTGVSINTVSMVLRGMSGISAPTRERVRRAAEEMGLNLSTAKTRLRRGRDLICVHVT